MQELRQYLENAAEYLYSKDNVLQFLFFNGRKDVLLWCSNITRMGVWATSFNTLIFSYIMKLNVIGIRNYPNGLYGNNMHTHLLQLRLPDLIPNKPAIHVLHHQLGSPMEIINNCNHFAYLKPTSLTSDERLNYDLQNNQRQPITFPESDVLNKDQES